MDVMSCTPLMCVSIFIIVFLQSLLRWLHGRSRVGSGGGNRRLPPGPYPFPVIGNLLELGNKPHKSLAKLVKTYGPIMSLQLGRVTAIAVSSPNMAKGVLLIHDQFLSDRTVPDALRGANHHEYSLPFLPVCPWWRSLRKLCNNQLFGHKVLDASQYSRHNKVQQLIQEVQQCAVSGEYVDIGKAAFKTTLNLLSNTMFSVDLVRSVGTVGEFRETVAGIMKEVGTPNVADYFPVLKKFDPQGVRRRTGIHFSKILDVFHHLVIQRKRLRENTASLANNDILDVCFLKRTAKRWKENGSNVYHFYQLHGHPSSTVLRSRSDIFFSLPSLTAFDFHFYFFNSYQSITMGGISLEEIKNESVDLNLTTVK